jgi:hypothetical protein
MVVSARVVVRREASRGPASTGATATSSAAGLAVQDGDAVDGHAALKGVDERLQALFGVD